MFSRQVQSVLYIILLQGLTKRLTDSPLSTCGDAVLSWRGRSHEVSPTPASNKGIKADYECSFYFIVAKHTTLLSLYVVFPLLLSHIWPHFLLLYWYRHFLICELRVYFLSNKGLLTVERTNLDCFGVFFYILFLLSLNEVCLMTVKLCFLWKESGGFGESNVVLYSVYIDCFCINNSYLFLNQKKSSS